jgi:hypothetical protein
MVVKEIYSDAQCSNSSTMTSNSSILSAPNSCQASAETSFITGTSIMYEFIYVSIYIEHKNVDRCVLTDLIIHAFIQILICTHIYVYVYYLCICVHVCIFLHI